jgi:Zn-finger nucleic acid-binding protein
MNCSTCAIEQVLTEPRAIHVEYCCMVCRGIDLDRSELDEVIERLLLEQNRSVMKERQPAKSS